MPKYMQKPFEGALTAEYYRDSHRSDLLIIGDCEVYENISPVTLWEAYGIPSYIRGNARQLLWQSRAMLEDSLRYETPKVVLLSVLCMIYGESPWDAEPYSRMVFDGMPLSAAKLRALRNSLLPEEEPLSYLFPLLRFHDRWNELGADDFRYFFRRDPVSVNGFVMRADTLAADWIPTPRLLPDYSFGQRAIDALDAITALCGEKGIQLVLFKAPSLMPHWYDEWDTWIADYARTRGLEYLNALALREEIGLDFSSDTYDAGLHLNLAGAEKMARYLGGWLRERCPTLTDRRTEADFAAAWETKTAKYRAWQAAQEHELQQDGELKSVMLYQALR
ncbi:MAG: SGNH/GDSL hydrolase family protein [Oscillospiraceae bacterium]|nr:SGNH/GDSL hydrolase family protein [Oscillospiraceae bacterium]